MKKIVIVYPQDNWILQKLGDEILKRSPEITRFNYDDPKIWESAILDVPGQINYFINYAVMKRKTKGIDVGFFTHPENDGGFFRKAKLVDLAICMNTKYTQELIQMGLRAVKITPGVDPAYKPKLRLAIVGSLRYGFRKGVDLIESIQDLPFVDVIITNGRYPKKELPRLFQSVDYTLICSRYEGGPMCLLESIACGKKVICPLDVGFANDFKENIVPYQNGDKFSLIRVLIALYNEKLEISKAVEKYTWDKWAAAHMNVFNKLN